MPAKRTYNVKVAKDFIVLSGICFFLGLWAVKDAWFTSDKVLKKHPVTVEVSFEIDGTLGKINVGVGDSIGEGRVLAELRRTRMKGSFESAKKEYTAAKNEHTLMQEALRNAQNNGASAGGVADIKESVTRAKSAMEADLETLGEIRAKMNSTELIAPVKGEIKNVHVVVHDQVKAGEVVMVIDPKDHFYLFNKSLAIFSFIAFFVFLALHLFAS